MPNKKIINTVAKLNIIKEKSDGEYVWIFCSFDESQKYKLVFVNFTEEQFLTATQKYHNCTSVFTEGLIDNSFIEQITEESDSFLSSCESLSPLKDESIYYGAADYSAMFYNFTTHIFRKGRN